MGEGRRAGHPSLALLSPVLLPLQPPPTPALGPSFGTSALFLPCPPLPLPLAASAPLPPHHARLLGVRRPPLRPCAEPGSRRPKGTLLLPSFQPWTTPAPGPSVFCPHLANFSSVFKAQPTCSRQRALPPVRGHGCRLHPCPAPPCPLGRKPEHCVVTCEGTDPPLPEREALPGSSSSPLIRTPAKCPAYSPHTGTHT